MSNRTASPDPPTVQKVATTLRIEEDLLDLLRIDAESNGRTVAQTVRFHIRRSLGMAA